MNKPVNIFIIYAREDKEEKRALLNFLSPMIDPYNLTIWHDEHIKPGQEWKPHIESRLNITDIFILLVSVNFLNSKFIKQVEFKYAIDRHKANKSVVIPVIIKYCLWDEPLPYDDYSFSLAQFQVLPTEGKPIVEWKSPDEAYNNIAKGIRSVIIERISNQKKQELQEEEFWNKTTQVNSATSYNEYIKTYAEGKFIKEAKNAVLMFEKEEQGKLEQQKLEIEKAKAEQENDKIEEEELWKSVININTSEAYNNYLANTKIGKFNKQANQFITDIEKKKRERIIEQENVLQEVADKKLWNDACNQNSISSYRNYLNKTLVGLYSDEAVQSISSIEKAQQEKEVEESVWKRTKSKNTIEAFQQYLKNYPEGYYSKDAKNAMILIEQISKSPDIETHLSNTEFVDEKNPFPLKFIFIGIGVLIIIFFVWKMINTSHPSSTVPNYVMIDTATPYVDTSGTLNDRLVRANLLVKNADYKSAWNIYKTISTDEYDTTALINIGDMYYYGKDVFPQDYLSAKRWYEKAIAIGSTEAVNNIGVLYENGEGVKKDYAQAKIWYEKAALAGNADGMYDLAYLYFYGHGVSKDLTKATVWFKKACKAGKKEACDELDIISISKK